MSDPSMIAYLVHDTQFKPRPRLWVYLEAVRLHVLSPWARIKLCKQFENPGDIWTVLLRTAIHVLVMCGGLGCESHLNLAKWYGNGQGLPNATPVLVGKVHTLLKHSAVLTRCWCLFYIYSFCSLPNLLFLLQPFPPQQSGTMQKEP